MFIVIDRLKMHHLVNASMKSSWTYWGSSYSLGRRKIEKISWRRYIHGHKSNWNYSILNWKSKPLEWGQHLVKLISIQWSQSVLELRVLWVQVSQYPTTSIRRKPPLKQIVMVLLRRVSMLSSLEIKWLPQI